MKRIGDGRFMRALTFRRQFFANAAIAASRVAASAWVLVMPERERPHPRTAAAFMIRPSYRAPSIGST